MRCPFCSFESTKVVDSRLTDPGDSIRRRRECAGCGNRFTTHERAEEVPVDVVKRDGTTQRFDRRKLQRGLVRAAGGRPVGGEQLEQLADAIAAEIRRGGPQVKAERIGDLAERGLARLDPVTAIQFASVYRRLSDLDELEEAVRRLRQEPLPGADQMPFEGIATGAQAGRWPAEQRSLDPVSDPSDPRSTIGRSPTTARRAPTETRKEDV
ncbi:MAG TPA: transcriptional regulator NrdR [Thermoleophilaceae bacterium]|nr:transcriptional regulator NrdR [Thermoleophilaceae bacterium]